MKTAIIIPARYASTRLPGKPLLEVNDKPIIQYVWEAAMKSKLADCVIVATDDDRINAEARELEKEMIKVRDREDAQRKITE